MLYWIPSHIGIPEIDLVDQLANKIRTDPEAETLKIEMSLNEIKNQFEKGMGTTHGSVFLKQAPRLPNLPQVRIISRNVAYGHRSHKKQHLT